MDEVVKYGRGNIDQNKKVGPEEENANMERKVERSDETWTIKRNLHDEVEHERYDSSLTQVGRGRT